MMSSCVFLGKMLALFFFKVFEIVYISLLAFRDVIKYNSTPFDICN